MFLWGHARQEAEIFLVFQSSSAQGLWELGALDLRSVTASRCLNIQVDGWAGSLLRFGQNDESLLFIEILLQCLIRIRCLRNWIKLTVRESRLVNCIQDARAAERLHTFFLEWVELIRSFSLPLFGICDHSLVFFRRARESFRKILRCLESGSGHFRLTVKVLLIAIKDTLGQVSRFEGVFFDQGRRLYLGLNSSINRWDDSFLVILLMHYLGWLRWAVTIAIGDSRFRRHTQKVCIDTRTFHSLEVSDLRLVLRQIKHALMVIVLPLVIDFVLLSI